MDSSTTRPLLYVLLAVGAVALTVTLAARPGRHSGEVGPPIRECRDLYANAATLADTLRTDAHYPAGTAVDFGGRTGNFHSGQCGDLRSRGMLAVHAEKPPAPPRYNVDTAGVLRSSRVPDTIR